MISVVCNERHPDEHDQFCVLTGSHGHHTTKWGMAWPNEPVLQESAERRARSSYRTKRGRTSALGALLTRVKVAEDAHPTSPEEWLEEAYEIFHQWLAEHSEPFTTPQHIWPMLDTPTSMRILSVVVQRLLREGAMGQVGSVRLRDTYRTRDGTMFSINKMVPLYQSLISSGPAGSRPV